jgi:hypothetical protein
MTKCIWDISARKISNPGNFSHKHHGAISSPYAQIRAGEFGGRKGGGGTEEQDNWFSKGLIRPPKYT